MDKSEVVLNDAQLKDVEPIGRTPLDALTNIIIGRAGHPQDVVDPSASPFTIRRDYAKVRDTICWLGNNADKPELFAKGFTTVQVLQHVATCFGIRLIVYTLRDNALRSFHTCGSTNSPLAGRVVYSGTHTTEVTILKVIRYTADILPFQILEANCDEYIENFGLIIPVATQSDTYTKISPPITVSQSVFYAVGGTTESESSVLKTMVAAYDLTVAEYHTPIKADHAMSKNVSTLLTIVLLNRLATQRYGCRIVEIGGLSKLAGAGLLHGFILNMSPRDIGRNFNLFSTLLAMLVRSTSVNSLFSEKALSTLVTLLSHSNYKEHLLRLLEESAPESDSGRERLAKILSACADRANAIIGETPIGALNQKVNADIMVSIHTIYYTPVGSVVNQMIQNGIAEFYFVANWMPSILVSDECYDPVTKHYVIKRDKKKLLFTFLEDIGNVYESDYEIYAGWMKLHASFTHAGSGTRFYFEILNQEGCMIIGRIFNASCAPASAAEGTKRKLLLPGMYLFGKAPRMDNLRQQKLVCGQFRLQAYDSIMARMQGKGIDSESPKQILADAVSCISTADRVFVINNSSLQENTGLQGVRPDAKHVLRNHLVNVTMESKIDAFRHTFHTLKGADWVFSLSLGYVVGYQILVLAVLLILQMCVIGLVVDLTVEDIWREGFAPPIYSIEYYIDPDRIALRPGSLFTIALGAFTFVYFATHFATKVLISLGFETHDDAENRARSHTKEKGIDENHSVIPVRWFLALVGLCCNYFTGYPVAKIWASGLLLLSLWIQMGQQVVVWRQQIRRGDHYENTLSGWLRSVFVRVMRPADVTFERDPARTNAKTPAATWFRLETDHTALDDTPGFSSCDLMAEDCYPECAVVSGAGRILKSDVRLHPVNERVLAEAVDLIIKHIDSAGQSLPQSMASSNYYQQIVSQIEKRITEDKKNEKSSVPEVSHAAPNVMPRHREITHAQIGGAGSRESLSEIRQRYNNKPKEIVKVETKFNIKDSQRSAQVDPVVCSTDPPVVRLGASGFPKAGDSSDDPTKRETPEESANGDVFTNVLPQVDATQSTHKGRAAVRPERKSTVVSPVDSPSWHDDILDMICSPGASDVNELCHALRISLQGEARRRGFRHLVTAIFQGRLNDTNRDNAMHFVAQSLVLNNTSDARDSLGVTVAFVAEQFVQSEAPGEVERFTVFAAKMAAMDPHNIWVNVDPASASRIMDTYANGLLQRAGKNMKAIVDIRFAMREIEGFQVLSELTDDWVGHHSTIAPTPVDGNCFYSAIRNHFGGDAAQIRSRVVDCVKKGLQTEAEYRAMLKQHMVSGTYAVDEFVRAASLAYSINILSPHSNGQLVLVGNSSNDPLRALRQIGNHWISLKFLRAPPKVPKPVVVRDEPPPNESVPNALWGNIELLDAPLSYPVLVPVSQDRILDNGTRTAMLARHPDMVKRINSSKRKPGSVTVKKDKGRTFVVVVTKTTWNDPVDSNVVDEVLGKVGHILDLRNEDSIAIPCLRTAADGRRRDLEAAIQRHFRPRGVRVLVCAPVGGSTAGLLFEPDAFNDNDMLNVTVGGIEVDKVYRGVKRKEGKGSPTILLPGLECQNEDAKHHSGYVALYATLAKLGRLHEEVYVLDPSPHSLKRDGANYRDLCHSTVFVSTERERNPALSWVVPFDSIESWCNRGSQVKVLLMLANSPKSRELATNIIRHKGGPRLPNLFVVTQGPLSGFNYGLNVAQTGWQVLSTAPLNDTAKTREPDDSKCGRCDALYRYVNRVNRLGKFTSATCKSFKNKMASGPADVSLPQFAPEPDWTRLAEIVRESVARNVQQRLQSYISLPDCGVRLVDVIFPRPVVPMVLHPLPGNFMEAISDHLALCALQLYLRAETLTGQPIVPNEHMIKGFSKCPELVLHSGFGLMTRDRMFQIMYETSGKFKESTSKNFKAHKDSQPHDHDLHVLHAAVYRLSHTFRPNLKEILKIDGIAGCGKTTKIKEFVKQHGVNNCMVLTQTEGGKRELNSGGEIAQTMASLLINVKHFDKPFKYLIIDEALMMHHGEITLAALITGAYVVVMFGDSQQIRNIDYLKVPWDMPPLPVEPRTIRLVHTYRLPLDAARLVSASYENPEGRPVTTSNRRVDSIEFHFNFSMDDIKKHLQKNFDPKDRPLIITMTNDECAMLRQLLPDENVTTTHRAQGASRRHVVLVRLQAKEVVLYTVSGKIVEHALVSFTRHTESMTYISVISKTADTFAEQIKKLMRAGVAERRNDECDHFSEAMDSIRMPGINNTTAPVAIRTAPLYRRGNPERVLFEECNVSEKNGHFKLKRCPANDKAAETSPPPVNLNIFAPITPAYYTARSMPASSVFLTYYYVPDPTYTVRVTSSLSEGGGYDCWYRVLKPLFDKLGVMNLAAAYKYIGVPFAHNPNLMDIFKKVAERTGYRASNAPCNGEYHNHIRVGDPNAVSTCEHCRYFKIQYGTNVAHVSRTDRAEATHRFCLHFGHELSVLVGCEELDPRKVPVTADPSLMHFTGGDQSVFSTFSSKHIPKGGKENAYKTVNFQSSECSELKSELKKNMFKTEIFGPGEVVTGQLFIPAKQTYKVTNRSKVAKSQVISMLTNGYYELLPDLKDAIFSCDDEIRIGQGLTIEAESLELTVSALFKAHKREFRRLRRNRCKFSTNKVMNTLRTLRNLLEACQKRNFNAPKQSAPGSPRHLFNKHFSVFANAYFKDGWREKVSDFVKHPVGFTDEYTNEWVKNLGGAKAAKYNKEKISLGEVLGFKYDLDLKSEPKATGSDRAAKELPKGQVINSSPPTVTKNFSPLFKDVLDRFRTLLRDDVLIAIGYDEGHINNLANATLDPTAEYQPVVVDFSAFDKSIEKNTFMFFCNLCEMLGMPAELTAFWDATHSRAKSISRLGMSYEVFYQTKSGDAATAFQNTIVTMLAMASLVIETCPDLSTFLGDDSLLMTRCKDLVQNTVNDYMAKEFNLTAKLIQNGVAEFCGGYLVSNGVQWRFMSDPIKRVEKLGVQDTAHRATLLDRFVSLGDRTRCYDNTDFNEQLNVLLNMKYHSCVDFMDMMNALYRVGQDVSLYLHLYHVEGYEPTDFELARAKLSTQKLETGEARLRLLQLRKQFNQKKSVKSTEEKLYCVICPPMSGKSCLCRAYPNLYQDPDRVIVEEVGEYRAIVIPESHMFERPGWDARKDATYKHLAKSDRSTFVLLHNMEQFDRVKKFNQNAVLLLECSLPPETVNVRAWTNHDNLYNTLRLWSAGRMFARNQRETFRLRANDNMHVVIKNAFLDRMDKFPAEREAENAEFIVHQLLSYK